MMNNKRISINYTDEKLRILVEEYITQQRSTFTFKGVCYYVLYRAIEEERTNNTGIYESEQLASSDSERVNLVLEKMVAEQRICASGSGYLKVTN